MIKRKQDLQKRYYFCYNPKIFRFLRYEGGLFAIFIGKTRDDREVSIFERTEKLEYLLEKYHKEVEDNDKKFEKEVRVQSCDELKEKEAND